MNKYLSYTVLTPCLQLMQLMVIEAVKLQICKMALVILNVAHFMASFIQK